MKRILKPILRPFVKPFTRRYNAIHEKLDFIINKLSTIDSIVEIKGAKFFVPNAPRDLIQNIQLSKLTFFELDILQSIDKFINEKSVIIDIGANVGNHTVYWANITNVKKIYSFEPIVTTFSILAKNIEINNLNDKVKIYNLGLSDTPTTGKIKEYYTDNTGMTRIAKADDGDIKLDKLDNIKEIMAEPAIDFVKIDVEDFEKNVLNGATQFFDKYKPAVFIESFDGENQYDFTYKYFKDLNYEEPIRYPECNYLFLHKNSGKSNK